MISTLLLSGANNHDWRRSSPFFAELLQNSGEFRVELSENPSETLEGDLSGFNLLVSDYNGPMWSEWARQNFVSHIENGAGLVLIHAANNCFAGWRDYEQMCGLVFRQSDGFDSGHGDFHRFAVTIDNHQHPVTRGVENFLTEDELYHRMVRVEGAQFEVLASAFSDPARGGTGQIQPVLLASHFGGGRVFHTLLGHLWVGDPNGDYRGASLVALENVGFQRTFLNGCRWAAGVLD